MRDITLEDTIYVFFNTKAFATNIPTTLLGSPVVSAYENEGTAEITAGITLGVDHDGVTGLNLLTIVGAAASGYEEGKDYTLVITTGTVDSVSVVSDVVGEFTIERAAWGATWNTEVFARVIDALVSLDLDHLLKTASGIPAITAGTFLDQMFDDGTATYDRTTDSLQAVRDRGDTLWITGPTAAAISDAVAEEALEDHDTEGTVGWSRILSVYAGSDGPGVYVDSNAANTNVVVGTDGTEANPVSTFVAARTLADALGLKVYYLEGNSDATLAATHADWEFIGIGSVSDNIVNLGAQDVSRSMFRNLALEGTQGGAGRLTARDCVLQDPGAGDTTLHIFAERCGFVDRIQVDTSNDNVFDQCYSLVAGTAAPVIEAVGASGTISIRHYSGGMEFEALSASHNLTWEGIGQVIFNANCNVNANVVVCGIGSVIDNTAGMANLNVMSLINMVKINAEVVDGLNVDAYAEPGQGVPPTTNSVVSKLSFLYKWARNLSEQSATERLHYADDGTTVDQKLPVSDDGVTYSDGEMISGP